MPKPFLEAMTVKEEGLRRRIGSEYIIGCYTIQDDGNKCFTDIRGEEGDIVKLSGEEQSDFIVKYSGKHLQEGQFYRFRWKLSDNNDDVVIVGDAEKIDNVRFLQGIFDARLKLNGSNLELFNNFQKTIFNEVTGARQTFIYELLQNANDYPYKDEEVAVQFIVSDHYLFFFHTGAYFNLRNIVGISSINQGEKAKNKETIGYKGIGFKTVFANNEYVYLRSGEWSLRFDRAYSEEQLFGSCPWSLMPIPTSFNELDKEAQKILEGASKSMRVQFALRHKSDAKENIVQLDHVFADDQILLFIPHVHKVEVIVDGKRRHLVEKDDKKWIVEDYSCPVSPELRAWVERSIKNGERVPEKFKDISRARISFAVAKDKKKLMPIEGARVYNYLPTELRLGFKFLFNADFIPDGSRSGLHSVRWNDYVMELCGRTFAKWWKSLFIQDEKGDTYDLSTVCNILPEVTNASNYGKLFLKGFFESIKELSCIPTYVDGNYELHKINDIILDVTGVISSTSPIFTDEEFYLFTGLRAYLPHKDIRCNTHLKNLLKHLKSSIVFNGNHLVNLCRNKDFITWLTNKENNFKFIGFLVEHTFIDNFWNFAIFLRADGTLGRADNTYYDIDKYIEDLGFLGKNIPRLEVDIRDRLSQNYKEWPSYSRKFKAFQEYQFTRGVFQNFDNFKSKFQEKGNSVKFIHFLATSHYMDGIPNYFPLCLSDNTIAYGTTDVFQQSADGLAFASHDWVEKSWIQFLHKDYFERNEEEVSSYLSSKCNIIKLTHTDCYKRFIVNENHLTRIAGNIRTFENNRDFYLYLSEIQEEIGNFSSEMRAVLTVLTTDGTNEEWLPITKTIFWNDDDWKSMTILPWMPDRCCMAISGRYFKIFASKGNEALRKLFSSRQIVQNFSVQAFYHNCFKNRMKDAFALITTKEISKAFMNFIYEFRANLFRNNMIDSYLLDTPILLRGEKNLLPIRGIKEAIFISCPEVDNLYHQPWFNKDFIAVCDEYYSDLFDSRERREFFDKWGISNFETISFVRESLLQNLDEFKDNLKDKKANVTFHRFFADIHDSLSEKEMEPIKDMPIYISSPNNDNGILVERSTNHYLPSEQLTQIICFDLVPISILDSIHPDYIMSDKDKKYFLDKLENYEWELEGFLGYIVKDGVKPEVEPYLRERGRNIRFWQWACGLTCNRKELKCFPMLVKGGEDFYQYPDKLYIANEYVGYEIEETIKDYVQEPQFVSDEYIKKQQEGKNYNWKSLFGELKVTITNKEIVFKDILPRLGSIKKTSIVSSLSPYTDEIVSKLKDQDKKMVGWIDNLQLLCVDGSWRSPKDFLVSGYYYDLLTEPLPDIQIPNLVSYQYITDCQDNEEMKRKVTKIIVAIADVYNSGLGSQTKLQEYKIKYFTENQSKYAPESHFRIIAQLNKAYNIDPFGMAELLPSLAEIQLFTTKGVLKEAREMYLNTVYSPSCDYMSNGITDLAFVSDEYEKYTEMPLGRFFTIINVKDGFYLRNLPQLRNGRFATYFWEEYAPKNELHLKDICTEENLWDIPCIPSPLGVKKPKELYDYRIESLRKMLNRLDGGTDKLPSIELPSWLSNSHLGFRSRLYFPDCIKYLKLNTADFRRDVLSWILTTDSEIIGRHNNILNEYIESALWLNGEKKWVPLKNLYALEWGNNTLKDNFNGNAYICNPSYMPDTKTNYDKLCALLHIKILTDADFKKRKDGKCYEDVDAIKEIRKRLLYLAYKYSPENWREIFDSYNGRLKAADISQCEKITYLFNDRIKTDLLVYAEDAKALWYVDSWKAMFRDVVEWIENKIGINGTFDNNFMRKLFYKDFNLFVMEQEGGSLPQDVLDLLSEEDKVGISVDELANAEQFNEVISESMKAETKKADVEVEQEEREDEEYIEEEDLEEEQDEQDDYEEEPMENNHEVKLGSNESDDKHSSVTRPVTDQPTDSEYEQKPGEVDGHYRSGTYVNGYFREDGTYVSGHWRSDTIVSPHTRDVSTGVVPTHVGTISNDEQYEDEPFDSLDNDRNYDHLGQKPRKPKSRRPPKPATQVDIEQMRSNGTPLELESLPPTAEELNILNQCGISPEQIVDTNYLAQLRLYNNLKHDRGEEPEETLEDFIRNAADVTTHPLRDGRYIYTCSAARGVMYISPSVWNKMIDDKWTICVYLNGQGSRFHYINSKEEFLQLVEKDDVVIKITGKEKVQAVNELYSGVLEHAKRTAYTLIRVASRTNMDAVFAHYVGAMAEKEDGYDYTEDL